MKKTLFLLLFPLLALFGARESLADHVGDYYDNRDNNHANMGTSSHPGLTYMASGYGIQLSVIPDKVVFGNSSTAVTSSRYWGSNPRAGYMRYSSRMQIAYDIYANNNAYWYPEHRDHDEVDYFFAQSPYYNVSQGSSGSEIDEMHKWFYTLNAFKSDTKALLTAKKLIAPTMQMIARRTRVSSDAEYLTGAAHPNAFDNYSNQAAMVAMATEMQASRIPPMVQIRVVEEDYDQRNNGLNFFEPYSIPSEKLFDTPQSISRLFLGFGYTRRMVVSAEDSYDANGLPLTYYWRVLRGNPEHVRIRSLNTNNSKVEITLDYHPETTIGNTARLSNLVSVGVFVNNGYYYSAPAFVNSYTKRNETRTYDQAGKITKIVYNSNDVDPVISFAKTWTSDEFRYDGNGTLTRIDRIKDGVSYNFTKEGYLIESFTPDNKPDLVARVTYSYNTSDYKVFWQKSGNSFNYGVCQEWVYSAWSACTDGVMSRTVQSALPDGCSGGSPVLTQSCGISDNPRTNVCTSWTYSGWSACADGVQSRTVLTSSPSGCSGGYPVLTQKCVATAPTCTSWTYSNWSDCDNGTKYRNIIFSSPTNCSGGSPILTQSCDEPAPTCTSWTYSNWSDCDNGTKYRNIIFSSPANCSGGSPILTQSCDVPAPTCTSWTYSSWSACSSNGTQTRSILSSSPNSCSGGSPILTQSCVAPTPTCTSWTYSDWSSCSENGTQSRRVLTSSPTNCSGGSPVLTQKCVATAPTCTSWTYSSWSACSSNGTQTRSVLSSSPNSCSGGSPILTQSCVAPTPTCTSWTYSDWSSCSSSGSQSRTVLTSSPSGCSGGYPVLTQKCVATAPTCTSWTYSNWSDCDNGTKYRNIIFSSPTNCSGGSPILTQSCDVPAPACTSWTYSDWTSCSSSGSQSRTVLTSSPSGCSGGYPVLTQKCVATAPTCTSWTYSAWSTCSSNGTQTRSILSSSPSSCSGGSPILTQSCVAPTPTCTSWTYSNWSDCDNGTKYRNIIFSTPTNCSGGSPILTQSCDVPAPTCTSWTYSAWSTCSSNGTQTRSILTSSPSSCSGGSPVLTQSCVAPTPTCTSWTYSDWSSCSSSGTQSRTVLASSPSGCSGGSPVLTQNCSSVNPADSRYKSLYNIDQLLPVVGMSRNTGLEQYNYERYLAELEVPDSDTPEETRQALDVFVTYGADENTNKLGVGERVAVVSSYREAFNRLPETESDLSDLIKIASGEWPTATSPEAERKAKEQFITIYKRIPDMRDPRDNAAVVIMAYGFRQKAINRNLGSEALAIKSFRGIYGFNPSNTSGWNAVQAIAYSGAARGVDTDGDLLTDEREILLGTDKNNPDTDGDGYRDGIEVLNGYNPKGEGKL